MSMEFFLLVEPHSMRDASTLIPEVCGGGKDGDGILDGEQTT